MRKVSTELLESLNGEVGRIRTAEGGCPHMCLGSLTLVGSGGTFVSSPGVSYARGRKADLPIRPLRA
jgi:hypothetical protein